MLDAGGCWLLLAVAAATTSTAGRPGGAAAVTPASIPYRASRLLVDGRADDWRAPSLRLELRHPAAPSTEANTVAARMVWDSERLWALLEVTDAEVVTAPAGVTGPVLFQWDSVELYVDSAGDGGAAMGVGDYQFLVTSDGRTCVMRGDELLEPLAVLVPKREDRSVRFDSAAVRTSSGYTVELAIPWSSIGVLQPSADLGIGLDVTWNDWTADHPQLPEVPLNLPNLARIYLEDKSAIESENPAGISADEARRIFERHYRPWGWSATPDFGFPSTWHRATLTGGPPLLERMERAGTLAPALAGLLMAGLAGAWLSVAALRRRHRRRMRTLLDRIAALDRAPAAPPAAAAADAPGSSASEAADLQQRVVDDLTSKIEAVRRLVSHDELVPRDVPTRAIAHVYHHLGESLSVEALSDALYVSRRTLQRAVAADLYCTPSELITAIRMREARRLLTVERRRVKEVAYAVGFVSVPHFSRTFKQHHGVPPSEATGLRD